MEEGQLQSSPGGPGGPVQAKSLSAQQGAPGMTGQPGVMTASGSPGVVPITSSTPTSSPGGNPVATALDPSYSTSNPFAVAPQMNDEDPRQNRYWRDRFGGDVMSGQSRGHGEMTS